ncbi:MAG: beta-ketoacyl-[acyl-carrier-protein] synthase family protein [Planctomycetota bacterium]|nr:beta-ketoacyl-[acyl-carrier-protein] synthase family protein [Planctomycetota bacterium]
MLRRRRVLITGIGIISPLGNREEFWQRLIAGETATRRLECTETERRFWPADAAGAPAVASKTLLSTLQESSRDDLIPLLAEPVIAHALAAALEAVSDAQLCVDGERVGCVIGTSKGGVHTLQQLKLKGRQDPNDLDSGSTVPPDLWWPMIAPGGAATAVSSLLEARGPLLTPVAACATGLASLVRAAELIETGQCDVVIAGSSDASLSPAIVASFRKLGVHSRQLDDPASAIRPFDRDRDGFLVGEGAGVFVLESGEHARRRGARPYAEWLAGGSVADTYAMTKLADNPEALCWLISDVLRRGNLQPGDIDYVSLHGTATRINDVCEMRAVNRAFGPARKTLSGSSIKGSIGHLLGAAGSVEFASMLLAMRDSILPPTNNLQSPEDEFEIDLVPRQARRRPAQHAMKLSLGFGGHLVAAAVRNCR